MGTEDDIRELIGRMTAAQRQGFHVAPAHLEIVLAALRAYLAGRAWLAKPRDPHDDVPPRRAEPYVGPAATLADLRRRGLRALTIACDAPNCWAEGRVLLDDLGLDEGTPVPDVPRWRGFRCRRCGGRRVRVTPDWSDSAAQGGGKVQSVARDGE